MFKLLFSVDLIIISDCSLSLVSLATCPPQLIQANKQIRYFNNAFFLDISLGASILQLKTDEWYSLLPNFHPGMFPHHPAYSNYLFPYSMLFP